VQLSRSLAPGTVERFKAALGTSLREGRQRTVGRVTSRTDEGRSIAEAKAAQIAALDWEDLDAYGLRVEEMKSPSGQLFRVKSLTYWDMEEWESDLYVSVRVYAASGWRKRWPYKAGRTRDGETLPPRP